MREILFRGFYENENGKETIYLDGREIKGEWVEGFLYINSKGEYEISYYSKAFNIERYTYVVISETVGQYTGLTDKNGKKIFEGDIVKTQPFYDTPYSDKRKSKEFIGVVEYKTKIFNGNKYYSKQCYHGEWGLKFYEDFGKYINYYWGELWNCEVIGNMHDPERLEVNK